MNIIDNTWRATSRILALTTILLFAPMTWAQSDEEADEGADADKSYFDEIIVSAEKTEKSILDTAMTITGFTSDMLQEMGIQDRDKLQMLVPGLQFGETVDQQGNGTSLRGIGTRVAGIEHHDLSVATYVDGAYTIGLYGVAPGGGFDLERVEIARGPQGTLNGRNSVAGSINYIYKKPTQEWDMDVMAQVDDVTQTRLNAAIGGPIMDNLSFRLTGGTHQGDGIQENVGAGEDMGAPDQDFWAAQLRFQTERFDSNVRFSSVRDQGVPTSQVQLANFNTTDPMIPAPLIGGYTEQNPPPTLELETNPYYLYATQNPSGPSSCGVGVPYMRCGDINNEIAHNRSGFNDSEGDMVNFYMQYDFTDNVSLRYTYADSEVAQYTFRDGDYTTREPGADRSLSSDGGVPYLDRTYEVTYDYDEDSHELLLTWDVNDQLDLIFGAFTYDSEIDFKLTRFEFSHDFRFVDPDVAAQGYDGVFDDPMGNPIPVNNCPDFIQNIIGPVFGDPTPIEPTGTSSFYFCPNQFGEFGRTHGDLTAIVPFGTGTSNSTEAVFVNADYEINEKWKVSGGLRFLEDEKDQPADRFGGSFMFSYAGVPLVIGFFEGGLDEPDTWESTIGQLTVEYRTDNDNMIYGRISTGHKPGVFNFSSPPIPGVPTSVEESELINYEGGIKGTWLDGRLQMAASAFYMDYDKMHLTAAQDLPSGFTQPQLSGDVTPLAEYIAAIPDSKVYGMEVEYSYAFNDSTSLVGYYAYTDSEVGEHASVVPGDPDATFDFYDYPDFDNPGETLTGFYQLPTDQTGNQLPAQPNHKLAATLIHDMPLADGGGLSLMGTYAYTGSMYSTIANIDLYEIPACNRFDVSAQYSAPDNAWSAMLYANNVADEICVNEFNAGNGFGGQAFLGSVTNKRVIGLTFRWNAF
jgi:outer membrane receptor protein involved in Fe transport